jgi:drug/metabolite transporter (DMT)-like permease
MLTIFLYLIISLGWSLPFFLIKDLTKYLSQIEILILSHLIWHVFILLFLVYTWIFNKNIGQHFITKIKNIPIKYRYYLIAITIISIISQFSYFTLLKKNNVSKVIPILNGLSNIAIVIIAYLLFKEKLTFIKLIGILLVIFGIYLIN